MNLFILIVYFSVFLRLPWKYFIRIGSAFYLLYTNEAKNIALQTIKIIQLRASDFCKAIAYVSHERLFDCEW